MHLLFCSIGDHSEVKWTSIQMLVQPSQPAPVCLTDFDSMRPILVVKQCKCIKVSHMSVQGRQAEDPNADSTDWQVKWGIQKHRLTGLDKRI